MNEDNQRASVGLARIEEYAEGIFFRIRWALVPGYLVLAVALLLLVYKTVVSTWDLFILIPSLDENATVVHVLGIVDIVLVMNLLLMVMFVGYVNFVSKIHFHKSEDEPGWLNKLTYGGLKVQMMGSILAIASVKLLRAYFGLGTPEGLEGHDLMWLVITYGAFVFALLCVAITNKLHVAAE